MPKHLLVFGGSGFVGGHIAQMAHDAGWHVVIVGSRILPAAGAIPRRVADVGNALAVRAVIEEVKPDVVVNTAALADVDRAEREHDLAWRVNVEGASHVAQTCRVFGAQCIYYSTDVVFDGLQPSYAEDAPTRPLNYYGLTKAKGEEATLEGCPDAAVIRVSLVLGFPVEQGNAYLPKLRDALRTGKSVPSPADEIRTPVDVYTAAAVTLELAETDFTGILHIGATQAVDRYSLAHRLAQAMGLRTDLIVPGAIYPVEGPQAVRAPRHKNGILDVRKAQKLLKTPLRSLDETILRSLEA